MKSMTLKKKNFKRTLAIVLAASMLCPLTAFGSSYNSINKSKTVAVDDYINDIYIKLQPNDEIVTGDSISLSIENAEFFTDDEDNFNPTVWLENGLDYDFISEVKNKNGEKVALDMIFENHNSSLPYSIKKRSKRNIDVSLYPISINYVGKDNINNVKPYYNIPINCRATNEGDIKVTIDSNETSISGASVYTIAQSVDSDGSTTSTIDEINYFEDSIYLDDITIKENIKGTFNIKKNNGEIKLRLSGGYVFDTNQDKFSVKAGINASFEEVTKCKVANDELTFSLPDEIDNTQKASSIIITGLKVITDDEDKWGDVKLTISGCGITKETIKVAERADYGFKVSLEDEVPTIYAGRIYTANSAMDEDDNLTAEIKFEELIPNTYIPERKLEFSVPEGVKIVKYEVNDTKRISGLLDKMSITEEGTVLRIDKGVNVTKDRTDVAEFKLKLYVSVDADFEGDIILSTKGAGLGEGVADDVVIAKAVTPIRVYADTTETNLGYQEVKTADIIIEEVTDGILLKGEKVMIDLDAPFGGNEIGFADSDIDYEIEGDLEIKNFDIKDGKIQFAVDKTSYTEPSKVTIKNVNIGSTRSVPYGAYDLKIYGSAIINNYDEDKESDVKYPAESEAEYLGYFDTTDSYTFKNYLVIKTVTGTFDDVVAVTIGNTNCEVNGIAYDMEVAPYIQASSNSTMIPLRFVSIALGVDTDSIDSPDASDRVVWNANTKTVTLYYGQGTNQKIIQFTAGSNNMIVDGNSIAMDYGVNAEITNGRMFVPFRALGNALGIKVAWDAETRTATYNG